MDRIKIGLVGIGKIARDQHLPALAGVEAFDLSAAASRHGGVDGIDHYRHVEEMLDARPDLEAVSLCTPPDGRFQQAMAVIRSSRHLMLEKPPTATMAEVATLIEAAASHGVTLFTTWHSREAAEVDAARAWLADKRISAVRIAWREDIRQWHPGQEWILAAGGFGVFDPGINALSIATRILPDPLRVTSAMLQVPENRVSPIAASLTMRSGEVPVSAEFDFLQTGPQSWDIDVDTDVGTLRLREGGSRLELPGDTPVSGPNEEYARLYRRFADLIRSGESEVDVRPLQLVADAFLLGRRQVAASFDF